MDKILKMVRKISIIETDPLKSKKPFIDLAQRFSNQYGTVVLMSGGDLDCARYHILGIKPWLTIKARNHSIEIVVNGQTRAVRSDPFRMLQRILKIFQQKDHSPGLGKNTIPFTGGLMGYLSYDLKDFIENLPRTTIDDTVLPQLCFFAPSIIVLHDKKNRTTRCFKIQQTSGDPEEPEALSNLFQEPLKEKSPSGSFTGGTTGFHTNFTKTEYIEAVERAKAYIRAGDIYQVNLSQRFETDFSGDPFSLFKALYQKNPAPFFAYINAGDHCVVSTSPERFVRRNGNQVETRPIKGTRPRGKTEEDDRKMRIALETSLKDDAELSMIVDLLRNDIGKVCRTGSVKVSRHKHLEAYHNVYHLVSIVKGHLRDDLDSIDLVRAVFPGGSITGCPKIRSMEIIDELEPHRRHLYTGAIGYFGFDNNMDFSVAIRTATIQNDQIRFSVGGGIVFDSDPADEYDETLHKGDTLLTALTQNHSPRKSSQENWAWYNGVCKPVSQIGIPATDAGFQFGNGLFETIRADFGKPRFLQQHIERFHRSWRYLFATPVPDLHWDVIIDQVLKRQRLCDTTAAVKIIATGGDPCQTGSPHPLLVMARPYTHRLQTLQKKGLQLAVYPHHRQTPLADHKTLNYLYYLMAGKWARDRDADEALILNPDKSVSETNTANILLIENKTVLRPQSRHALAGIMERVVCEHLVRREYRMVQKKLSVRDLFSAKRVILTNALMGVVPVIAIGRRLLKKPDGWCEQINSVLLNTAEEKPFKEK